MTKNSCINSQPCEMVMYFPGKWYRIIINTPIPRMPSNGFIYFMELDINFLPAFESGFVRRYNFRDHALHNNYQTILNHPFPRYDNTCRLDFRVFSPAFQNIRMIFLHQHSKILNGNLPVILF